MRHYFSTILIIIALVISSVASYAQNKTFEIYYIGHDIHFEESLRSTVEDIYQTASFDENRHVYLYLAYADAPTILKCEPDNQEEFDKFMNTMSSQSRSTIWPETDIGNIITLLDKDDFLDENGAPKYDLFMLNFYVTNDFWTYKYNESLIGRLFWDLNLDKMASDKFTVNIYRPKADDFEYSDENLFGKKNLPGDYPFFVLTY